MRQWMEKLKNDGRNTIVILLLLGVLLLVIALPAGEPQGEGRAAGETQEQPQTETAPKSVEQELEERLRNILRRVEGIGEVEVMIAMESSGRRIVEKDLERTQSTEENSGGENSGSSAQDSSRESTVYLRDAQGNETPYVVEELAPQICGVLVTAQGAGNSVVAAEITEAVMALFGVQAHKIKVMKME